MARDTSGVRRVIAQTAGTLAILFGFSGESGTVGGLALRHGEQAHRVIARTAWIFPPSRKRIPLRPSFFSAVPTLKVAGFFEDRSGTHPELSYSASPQCQP